MSIEMDSAIVNHVTGIIGSLTQWANDHHLRSKTSEDEMVLVNEDTGKVEAKFPTYALTITSEELEVVVKILQYQDQNLFYAIMWDCHYAIMWDCQSLTNHNIVDQGDGLMVENPSDGQVDEITESIKRFVATELL